MMNRIDIIPSKSYAHRALICAALSPKKTRVICRLHSEDVEATRRCLEALSRGEEGMECGESGSTLRFLVPVVGALGRTAVFYTKGRLPKRPMSPLREELEAHGMTLSEEGESPLTVSGRLRPGLFRLPGNVSSQFVSGILLALPLLEEDSTIEILGELQSAHYVDMTVAVMRDFGIEVEVQSGPGISYHVSGRQQYHGGEKYVVEGDWSSAAFWLTAAAIGDRPLTVGNLNLNSLQGDRRIADLIKQFGAHVAAGDGCVTVSPGKMSGSVVDVSDIPDLAPAIALLGAAASGTTKIANAERLRLKESDRLSGIADVLSALGGDVIESRDSLLIGGQDGRPLEGGVIDPKNDHRIAMMAAVASLICRNPVRIKGSACVAKSYPGFFRDLKKLGLDKNVRAEE